MKQFSFDEKKIIPESILQLYEIIITIMSKNLPYIYRKEYHKKRFYFL